MTVSGHKSVQSLATYQKARDTQKMQMSEGLFQAMTCKEDEIQIARCPPLRAILPKETAKMTPLQNKVLPELPPPTLEAQMKPNVVQNKENSTKEVVPYEPNFDDVPDIHLLSVLADLEKLETKPDQVAVTTTTTNTQNILNNVPRSLFSNCTIGNVHFHINK